ncbi:hypothetical protein CPLU01_11527 [Colletotrichum plurivorum]|uniref:Uncharacterized protein n=1 Tax=Colletotrichum plurivorum TaxID=2175906 RepID=A0A8H6K1Z4_9PEZI|nr:hypothetical protein CPLU01_11527 [Colletotrichum plurivorum]
MAELALGIIGIAPLVGGAIKAYKEVNLKMKLFRQSSRETAMEMASNPDHDRWADPELDTSFRSRLKDNHDGWLEAIKDISDSIEELETSLAAFKEGLEEAWSHGSLGQALRRDARMNEEVQMNLAIVCRSHTRDLIQSTLVQLEVRSQNLDWIDEPRLTGRLPAPDDDRQASGPRKRLKVVRLRGAEIPFHSTPWLGDCWRLRDLAFFKSNRDEEVSEALRTLHVGIEVTQRQVDSMEDVQSSADCSSFSQVSEDERLFCGIDNLTLHSLGVALLQIDRWTRVEPGDVLKVRKMSLRSSSLGPRYQEITQKCLRCDFGYGADLTKPRLQEAVYDNVAEIMAPEVSY